VIEKSRRTDEDRLLKKNIKQKVYKLFSLTWVKQGEKFHPETSAEGH
jgi:hypothetical protein